MTKYQQIQTLLQNLEQIQLQASKGGTWDCKELPIGEFFTMVNEVGLIYTEKLQTL